MPIEACPRRSLTNAVGNCAAWLHENRKLVDRLEF
jgi:hypothetical protein